MDGILKSKEDELTQDGGDATNESQGPTPQGGDSVTPSQQISPLPKDNPQKLAKGGTVNKNTKSTQEKTTSNLRTIVLRAGCGQ